MILPRDLIVSNGDLDLDTRLNANGGDAFDHVGRRLQVNDSLVDLHFVAIPGLATLTTRGLAGGDAEDLCRHADRALWSQLGLLGLGDQVRAD